MFYTKIYTSIFVILVFSERLSFLKPIDALRLFQVENHASFAIILLLTGTTVMAQLVLDFTPKFRLFTFNGKF
jgi:hypothetical protein